MNKGDGTYGAQTQYQASPVPYGLGASDMDDDGDIDIVVGCTQGAVDILINDGTGVFIQSFTVAVSPTVRDISIDDLDNDGAPDVVVAHESGVSVLLNTGSGILHEPVQYDAGTRAFDTALGDIDNDGDLDITVATFSMGQPLFSTLRNDGSGVFTDLTFYGPSGDGISVDFGDIDGDGDLDVVVAVLNSPFSVGVFLNDGTGNFVEGEHIDDPGDFGPRSIVLVDINNDSIEDVVYANIGLSPSGGLPCGAPWWCQDTISVYLGVGDGTFAPLATRFDVAAGPRSLAVSDLNSDGWMDLVTANHKSRNVAVLLHQGDSPTCYADCDGDGVLDIFDYTCFGDAFTNAEPYADCDANSVLNILDFICFGSAFAAGCP